MATKKFQVLEGVHVHTDGRAYAKGDIVESPHDMISHWPNKFAKVDSVIAASPGHVVEGLRGLEKQATALATSKQEGAQDAALQAATAAGAKDVLPKAPKVVEEDDEETGDGKEPKNSGKDVTDKFESAIDEDYKVFEMKDGITKKKKFFVYNADDMAKPINATGAEKADVEDLIKADLNKGK